MKFTRLSVLLATLSIVAAAPLEAVQGPTTNDELKVALHDILKRNDLSDVAYLSQRLGLGLHSSNAQPAYGGTSSMHFIASSNPSVIYGAPLGYDITVNAQEHRLSSLFVFSPRQCPSVLEWAKEWHVSTTSSVVVDVGGTALSVQWPGTDSISLSVATMPDHSCPMSLSQTLTKDSVVPNVQASAIARAPVLEKILRLLTIADLRKYSEVANILGSSLTVRPETVRQGLLVNGSASLDHVVPGIDPEEFPYSAEDTGWARPASFGGRPLHLTNRTAELQLVFDRKAICLTALEVESAIERLAARIRRGATDREGTLHYSVEGVNLLTMAAHFDGGCLLAVAYGQRTDIGHNPEAPLLLRVSSSLERGTNSMTRSALGALELLRMRLLEKSPALADIAAVEVVSTPMDGATAAEIQRTEVLNRQVRKELQRGGVTPAMLRAGASQEGICGGRAQGESSTVCVDVWLSN